MEFTQKMLTFFILFVVLNNLNSWYRYLLNDNIYFIIYLKYKYIKSDH